VAKALRFPAAFSLASLDDTRLMAELLAESARAGDIILLTGEVGAGKTTFSQFFIRKLCGQEVEVTSPTFTLVQSYPFPEGKLLIHHYDFYRMQSADEFQEIGVEEALGKGICLMEWPEKVMDYLPARQLQTGGLHLHFESATSDEGRRVSVNPGTDWLHRLQGNFRQVFQNNL
jgi:tRNA threonylcarbamoyl adenosine modification protein YjeE